MARRLRSRIELSSLKLQRDARKNIKRKLTPYFILNSSANGHSSRNFDIYLFYDVRIPERLIFRVRFEY